MDICNCSVLKIDERSVFCRNTANLMSIGKLKYVFRKKSEHPISRFFLINFFNYAINVQIILNIHFSRSQNIFFNPQLNNIIIIIKLLLDLLGYDLYIIDSKTSNKLYRFTHNCSINLNSIIFVHQTSKSDYK